jgi:hypothetical protein
MADPRALLAKVISHISVYINSRQIKRLKAREASSEAVELHAMRKRQNSTPKQPMHFDYKS